MHVYEFAKTLTRDAGNFIRTRMNEAFKVNSKSNPNDLVTTVDLETEKYIRKRIKEEYPEHNILGEEFKSDIKNSKNGYLWVVDPIDGTLNFVHQRENFAVSVGIYKDGKPYAGFILDVMKDKLYSAKAGAGAYVEDKKLESVKDTDLSESLVAVSQKWLVRDDIKTPLIEVVKKSRSPRSLGSAALEYAQLAEGKLDAALFFRLSPWDFFGGMIIGNEVGIVTSDLLGRENNWLERTSILAANPSLQKEISDIIKKDATFIQAHDDFHNIRSNDQ